MLGNTDIDWLEANYAGIEYISSKNILKGCLWFRMAYSPLAGRGIIDPNKETEFTDAYTIEDVYEIIVVFDEGFELTKVWEKGGRILHTKKKWNLSYADVHMYEDG